MREERKRNGGRKETVEGLKKRKKKQEKSVKRKGVIDLFQMYIN